MKIQHHIQARIDGRLDHLGSEMAAGILGDWPRDSQVELARGYQHWLELSRWFWTWWESDDDDQ